MFPRKYPMKAPYYRYKSSHQASATTYDYLYKILYLKICDLVTHNCFFSRLFSLTSTYGNLHKKTLRGGKKGERREGEEEGSEEREEERRRREGEERRGRVEKEKKKREKR